MRILLVSLLLLAGCNNSSSSSGKTGASSEGTTAVEQKEVAPLPVPKPEEAVPKPEETVQATEPVQAAAKETPQAETKADTGLSAVTDDELFKQMEVLLSELAQNMKQVTAALKSAKSSCSKAAKNIAALKIDGASMKARGRTLNAEVAKRPKLIKRLQDLSKTIFEDIGDGPGSVVDKMAEKCAKHDEFQAAMREASGMGG